MEKQTKILGIAALIIAGLFYWNSQSVSAANKKAIEDKAAAEKLAAEKAAADKATAEKLAADKADADKAATEKLVAEKAAADKAAADKQEADRIAAAEKALYDLMHPTRNIEISYSSVKSDEWNSARKYFDVAIPKAKNDKFYNLELTFYNGFGNVEKVRNITDSYIEYKKPKGYIDSDIQYMNNMVDNFIVELNIITEPNYKYGIVVSILENAGLPNERIVKIPMKTIDIRDTFIAVYE